MDNLINHKSKVDISEKKGLWCYINKLERLHPQMLIFLWSPVFTTTSFLSTDVIGLLWQNLSAMPGTWNETSQKSSQVPNSTNAGSCSLVFWVIACLSTEFWYVIWKQNSADLLFKALTGYSVCCCETFAQFACLHMCSWPATSRFWAWGTYFAHFRLWNVTLDEYSFIYSTEIKASLFFQSKKLYLQKTVLMAMPSNTKHKVGHM